MKVSLIVVKGKPEGMEIPLKGAQFLIGRDPKCNLRPNNDLISKTHCAFKIVGEKVFVADLKSTNGTFVNGERLVDPREIQHGDLVKVGALVFSLKITAKPAPVAVDDEDIFGDSSSGGAAGPSPGMSGAMADWLSGEPGKAEPATQEDTCAANLDQTVHEMRILDSSAPVDQGSAPADTTPKTEKPGKNDSKKPYRPAPSNPTGGDTHSAASDLLNRYLARKREK